MVLFLSNNSAFSQSPTIQDEELLNEEVTQLKEKIANKVQELKETQHAIAGVVASNDEKLMIIDTESRGKMEIEIDGTLTEFFEVSGSSVKEIKQEDIDDKDYIFITGPEIADSITANAVYKDSSYFVFSGKIAEVNNDDYSIRIITVDKSNVILDIESSTDVQLMDIQTLETEKIGFSKLKEGDSIHGVVKRNTLEQNQDRFSAEDLLIIPNEYFIQ